MNLNFFKKLLNLPVAFFEGKKRNSAENKIWRASSALSNIIQRVVIDLAPQFLSIIIGFFILFYLNSKIAFFIIFAVIFYIFIIFKTAQPLASIASKGNKAYNKGYGFGYDALSNYEAVKKLTTENYEFKRVKNQFLNVALPIWYRVEKAWVNINFYQRLIIIFTQAVVFILSVFLIQKGEMTIGDLIILNGYIMMIFGPFTTLGLNWQIIQNGIVNINTAEDILNFKPEKYHPKNEVKMDGAKGDIEFQNVSFHYNKKDGDVLKGINLKVKAGETVALVGESGVGKSILIDLVSAFYFAQKGKVLVDGVDIKRIGLKFLRQNIAFVPQEVTLFNDIVKTNIKYGNFKATDKEVEDAAEKSHCDVFINKFPKKYKQQVGNRGVKLSVGQKQRIAIARAILKDPKILILDEPTSALDSKSEKFIVESMEKLMQGRTTFIIAHRLSTVRKADRIFVFKDGKIVEEGSHEKLIKIESGVYRKLYEMQMGLS
jgi:ATP-binding cassette subfamily B protein